MQKQLTLAAAVSERAERFTNPGRKPCMVRPPQVQRQRHSRGTSSANSAPSQAIGRRSLRDADDRANKHNARHGRATFSDA
jgi:hypothetical protein